MAPLAGEPAEPTENNNEVDSGSGDEDSDDDIEEEEEEEEAESDDSLQWHGYVLWSLAALNVADEGL